MILHLELREAFGKKRYYPKDDDYHAKAILKLMRRNCFNEEDIEIMIKHDWLVSFERVEGLDFSRTKKRVKNG